MSHEQTVYIEIERLNRQIKALKVALSDSTELLRAAESSDGDDSTIEEQIAVNLLALWDGDPSCKELPCTL